MQCGDLVKINDTDGASHQTRLCGSEGEAGRCGGGEA
jgi:hypothetical protein